MSSVLNLGALVGDKPIYKSITAWGLVLWVGVGAALNQACGVGVLSAELCATIGGWTDGIGQVLTFLGIRRAATAPNTT